MMILYADDSVGFDRDIDCDGIDMMSDEYDGDDGGDCDGDGHVNDGGDCDADTITLLCSSSN